MSHTVEHHPLDGINGWPWTVTTTMSGAIYLIRCPAEDIAARVAQALDLLDANEAGPRIERGDISDAELDAIIRKYPHRKIFIEPAMRFPLPEAEIMQRAREAEISVEEHSPIMASSVRSGRFDTSIIIRAAARALRDLSKPLSELVPEPVDPDLIEARKIAATVPAEPSHPASWMFTMPDGGLSEEMSARQAQEAVLNGKFDNSREVQSVLAALKRGRELERDKTQEHRLGDQLRAGLGCTASQL